MKLTYIADDLVFPCNSGGRQAMRGELEALRLQGHDVRVIMFCRELPVENDLIRNHLLGSEVLLIERSRFVFTTLQNLRLPYQVASRKLGSNLNDVLKIAEGSAVVIASHEWTLLAATRIAQEHQIPLVLRSHNDEIKFMLDLAEASGPFRKLYAQAEASRLAAAHAKLLAGVSSVFVISPQDAHVYRKHGVETKHVPPVLSSTRAETDIGPRTPPATKRILFVGALDIPHTVDGLYWFVENVWPKIIRIIPDATFEIVGRQPSLETTKKLMEVEGVLFRGEIPSLDQSYEEARIFVNPIHSGSGVNMKVGPPSSLGIPIVTTSIGARGLEPLTEKFVVADDAEEMANACCNYLVDDKIWRFSSLALQKEIEYFTPTEIGKFWSAELENIAFVNR